MADIFISYSRRDSEQAVALAERLRASGASVWIDTAALTAAETWSAEIVIAINSCKTFIILLSPDSVASHNVTKELSLASEKRKTIVPIIITECTLNEAMEYALAGLQQVSITDEAALERAFAKLGVHGSGFSQVVTPRSTSRKPSRMVLTLAAVGFLMLAIGVYFLFFSKSHDSTHTGVKRLAVLPFESLSADKENDYFADGMTATLIDMLVPISELRVIDRKSSMVFKGEKKDIKSIASELNVRYIVDGSIQWQAQSFRISVQMTDTETGKVLLSKTFDGTIADLIAVQQQIAKNIVIYLQLTFNPNMVSIPPDAATSSPEAYNLCLIAASPELFGNYDSIRVLYLHAAKLDTVFAFPYLAIVLSNCNDYKSDPAPRKLVIADSFYTIGKRLDTAQVYSHFVGSFLATTHQDYERAIDEANRYLEKRPEDCRGFRALALAYEGMGRYAMAADKWIEDLRRNPLATNDMYALLLCLWNAHDTARLTKYAADAIPLFTASIARHPDRRTRFNMLPLALVFGGRVDEAGKQLDQILNEPGTTGMSFWWAAGVNALGNRPMKAMELLKKSIAVDGLREIDLTWRFLDNLRTLPEFQALIKQKAELLKADTAKHG